MSIMKCSMIQSNSSMNPILAEYQDIALNCLLFTNVCIRRCQHALSTVYTGFYSYSI